MGFFDSVRSFASGPELSDLWDIPVSESDLSGIFSDSSGTYLIYKHSYRCGTCVFSLRNLEKNLPDIARKARPVFIDVVKQRGLSNFVAEMSGVRHESPQALLIHNGDVVWHDSHGGVRSPSIEKALQEIRG